MAAARLLAMSFLKALSALLSQAVWSEELDEDAWEGQNPHTGQLLV